VVFQKIWKGTQKISKIIQFQRWTYMLESELKSKVNKLWDKFRSGGLTNPTSAIKPCNPRSDFVDCDDWFRGRVGCLIPRFSWGRWYQKILLIYLKIFFKNIVHKLPNTKACISTREQKVNTAFWNQWRHVLLFWVTQITRLCFTTPPGTLHGG